MGTSIGWGSFVVTGSNYLSKAVLLSEDYKNRDELLAQIEEKSTLNTSMEDGIVVAAGMASRKRGENFQEVFHRADELMYIHKNRLKELRLSHVLR